MSNEVVTIVKDKQGEKKALFICPGCGSGHAPLVESKSRKPWGFNGDLVKPTFTPSVLVRSVDIPKNPEKDEKGDYVLGPDGRIKGAKDSVCHSFVTNGHIKFLDDCTHELAGKTVPLKPI